MALMNGDNRSLIWAGVGLGVLLLAATAVVLGADSVTDLDPDSPEGVVQRYVNALIEGDEQAALALKAVSDDGCFGEPDPKDFRLTLSDVEVNGSRATVEVGIARSGGDPPFDQYSYVRDEQFELIQVGSDWRVAETPFDFRICEGTR